MTAKNTVQLNDVKFSLQLGQMNQQMGTLNARLSQLDQLEAKFNRLLSSSQM